MRITIEPEDTEHYRAAACAGTATAADMPVSRALRRATGIAWESSPSRAWYRGRVQETVYFSLPQPLYRLQHRALDGKPPVGALVFDLLWPPAPEDEPAGSAGLKAGSAGLKAEPAQEANQCL